MCVYIERDTLVPSKPSLTSHKTCQGVQNRSIKASQSQCPWAQGIFMWRTFLPCDGASLHLVKLMPWGEIWGRSHIQIFTKIMSPDFSCTHRQQLSQGWRISLLHLGLQGVSYSFCKVKSTDTSFPKFLLLVKSYFCWLRRAFDLSEQQVLSRRKFISRLASPLLHKDHFSVKNRWSMVKNKNTMETGPFQAGNHENSAEWSCSNVASYSDIRQERHNTKLQCDAAR